MIQISAKHKVVGVPYTAQLANLFPAAKAVDVQGLKTLLLPHGLQETLMLRNLGVDVPAPILSHYVWTGTKAPFDVQRHTAAVLTTNQRGYCLNGMGTGKTKAALWSFDYLRGKSLANKMLVVAPLSTLDNVWRAEAFATTPHLSVGVLYGDKKKRLKVLNEDHDIYVINIDGLAVVFDQLMARTDIDVFVIDELALFRNFATERNRYARKLAARMQWVWGMTGSPTPTEPTDAFGQCKIVTPNAVPKYFSHFRDATMLRVSQFKFVAKKEANDVVFAAMQPAVRYTLDDVQELPPMIEREVVIKLGTKQEKIYEAIRQHAFAQYSAHAITAVNAGAVLNKLLQISIGCVYSDNRGVVTLDGDMRLDQLVVDIEASPEKCIVFVPFTHALDHVFHRLGQERIECALVDGRTPKKERDHIFSLFQQTSKYKCIVAHPVCMSHGLNLTAATTTIWYGPCTSLETFEQANARIRRAGQSKKQQTLMYQATPVEKRTYARLRARQQVQDNLLSMFAADTD